MEGGRDKGGKCVTRSLKFPTGSEQHCQPLPCRPPPFCELHPGPRASSELLSSADTLTGLAEFELEVAMTYLDDRALRRLPLYEERYMSSTPAEGPLARSGDGMQVAGRRPCRCVTDDLRAVLRGQLGGSGSGSDMVLVAYAKSYEKKETSRPPAWSLGRCGGPRPNSPLDADAV